MKLDRIIRDARDPNSKDNTFRLFWADYQKTAAHIRDRNILCFPMKTLEANVKLLAERVDTLRKCSPEEREKVALEVLDLVERSQATMEQLLKL